MFKELKGRELRDSAETFSRWILRTARTPSPVIGINGHPGSGKTTLASRIKENLEKAGKRTVSFSIDDFYWSYDKREKEARKRKLLDVRGPGTHDTRLAAEVIRNLSGAKEETVTRIPRFNKWLKGGKGDRAPKKDWQIFKGRPDFIIFEGWNLCEAPVNDNKIKSPVNRIESRLDPDSETAEYINSRLKTDYSRLWKYIELLIMIYTEDFDDVYRHRLQQEKELRAAGKEAMTDRQVRDFVDHYQRWVQHIAETLPETADIVVEIDAERRIKDVKCRQ